MNATQEFAATIEECRKLIDQISQCVEDHLDAHPDLIDWGNVGDAKRLMADLLNITAYLHP